MKKSSLAAKILAGVMIAFMLFSVVATLLFQLLA